MESIIEGRRKQLHMSQAKIATRLGITRQHYNKVENFKNPPSVKLAKEVAEILDVDWTIFFPDKVNK